MKFAIKVKMNFLSVVLLLSVSLAASGSSILTIDRGVYKRLTVQILEEVDNCHCDQVIENIQVRNTLSFLQPWCQTKTVVP